MTSPSSEGLFHNYMYMPTIKVSADTPTIQEIWLYTYRMKKNRFDYMDRDILPSKIRVNNKTIYSKNKKSSVTTPDEKLEIITYSAPQYGEYLRHISKGAKKQMKYKHHYDITFVLQKDSNGEYSFSSKIKWRVGSFKLWEDTPSQSQVKSILPKTRERLKKKYTNKKTGVFDRVEYTRAKELIKKKGKYLSVGDYNSQVKGLNGDFYWRQMPLCYSYNCLYGPLTQPDFNTTESNIIYPFYGKHELATIFYLLRKKVLKK